MMFMKHDHEPKLCSNCPLTEAWKQEALKRLMQKQYTTVKEEPSAHRICMERRAILKELGLECPYFSEAETLDYHTNETFKERIDQKNELRKRQNITHFL
jgi:hypothetical protein